MIGTTRTLLPMCLILFAVPHTSDLSKSEGECARTAQMRIYSSVSIDKQTRDLDGIELAIDEHKDFTVHALLYVYEGAANDDGIHISGTISGNKLSMEGNWIEHLTEYPSKREIVQTHFVRIDGTLDSAWFRGRVKIGGLFIPDGVRLRRVHRIWVCK